MATSNSCLQDIDIFKDISAASLAWLEENLKKKDFRKGEVIYRTGDKGKIFLLKRGRVEVYYLDEDGKKYIIDYFKKGNIFGDFQLDLPADIYTEAVEETTVLTINSDMFFDILMDEPKLLIKLFQYFIRRLSVIYHKSASLAIDNVNKRLIKILIYLGKKNPPLTDGRLVTDKYTHEQLAQMLGVSRQIVTTLLNDMEKKKVISREKKRFIFHKSRLQAFQP
jgi:CRP-like cAMP-binding protein